MTDTEKLIIALKKRILKSELFLSNIGLGFAVIAVATSVLISVNQKKNENQAPQLDKYKKEYFNLINQLLLKKDSSNIDIETLKFEFNSVNRESNGKLFNYGFINVLEDYLVFNLNEKDQMNSRKYQSIVQLIKNEIKQEPFSQLPADQRRVLKSLEGAIKSKDSTNAIYNLTELNDILINKNTQLISLERENNWSMPLAIAGLVVTILFGITSILSPFSTRKMKNAIQETIASSNSKKQEPNATE